MLFKQMIQFFQPHDLLILIIAQSADLRAPELSQPEIYESDMFALFVCICFIFVCIR